jgi:CubicO group peptidase (beta-lactamase class C family)
MKSSHFLISITAILLLAVIGGCQNETPKTGSPPRSAPEIEGVSSEGIITFLDSAAVSRHEFHSFMFLRHGKVIAEGWWNPYKPELRHTLYSTSKSFTSTAVGFAVTEKLMTVHDKVISFFPDQLPDTVSPFLAEMTVSDLLTMSAGQAPDPTWAIRNSDSGWITAFLATPVLKKPGSVFLYNSMATFMLSAIVQKVSGEKIIDYLKPRLFDPLGIEGMDWEVSPDGINTGGWGLRVKTEDMAKFGQLYLQKGEWNGNQVIPSAWVEEATTFKIDQDPGASQAKRDSSDWLQGYCYQFWRCRHNAFRADGAYGQFIIVMPEKDAVIAITCESPDMQDEINLVWKYLFPAIKDEALPENRTASETLRKKLSELALPLPATAPDAPLAAEMATKVFRMEKNDLNIETVSFDFTGESCRLSIKADGRDYKIPFGSGQWIMSETVIAGPNILSLPGSLPLNKIAGAYQWKNDSTVELILRYIESPHHYNITATFDNDSLNIIIHVSIPPGYDMPPLKGTVIK